MAYEIYIGRNEQQMRQQFGENIYIVPDECGTVSSPHAKLTIHNNGEWQLEDLGSKNGTYLRDANGEFERVYNIQITPDSVIRFGVAGHMSHTCWASHIKNWQYANANGGDKEGYFYEFSRLQQYAKELNKAIARREAINARHSWIVTFSSGFVMLVMVVLMLVKDQASFSQTDMIIRMSAMSIVPPIFKAFFSGDGKKIKELKQKRVWLLSCPRCFMPLTDVEIDNLRCNKCKAK